MPNIDCRQYHAKITMDNLHIAVAETLMDIEKELRALQLWDGAMISEEALASEQPFAIDTMTFPQWLQFIFLPRMYVLIEQKMQFPGNCGIAPMAEQYFSVLGLPSSPLITHLQKIDALLTRQ
ncbi:MAG: YqcC family protein [Cellvibrio sp.]|nr:YqcC family protein [Cellvibrio sp.]MDF3012125.1 YqcC family protein [Cellvibrio sp.]